MRFEREKGKKKEGRKKKKKKKRYLKASNVRFKSPPNVLKLKKSQKGSERDVHKKGWKE